MATKKRTKQASATTRKAVAIYAEQKETYQKMLKTKVRQGKSVTTAAKEASKTYKELYGATPTSRWRKALKDARTGMHGTLTAPKKKGRGKK